MKTWDKCLSEEEVKEETNRFIQKEQIEKELEDFSNNQMCFDCELKNECNRNCEETYLINKFISARKEIERKDKVIEAVKEYKFKHQLSIHKDDCKCIR